MGSISNLGSSVQQIQETARTVAYREHLPWDLKALRKAGLGAVCNMKDEYLAKKENLGGVSFEQYAQRAIEKAMMVDLPRFGGSS